MILGDGLSGDRRSQPAKEQMDDSAADDIATDEASQASDAGEPATEPTVVDTWLESLGDPPCGEDLEYDNDFLALTQAVAGKPETTFSDAEPPDWRAARTLAEGLLERTRDLRVAVMWARAMLNLEGAASLPEGMRLVHGLLDRHWDSLHPVPDDGDAYARVNTLTDMCSAAGLLGDLRAALVVRNRSIGELTGRDIDIATGRIEARDDESPLGKSNVQQLLRDAVADDPAIAQIAPRTLEALTQLADLGRDRFGYDSAPDLQPLVDAIEAIGSLMPVPEGETAPDGADAYSDTSDGADSAPAASRGSGRGLGDSIESRDDALRALDMVCEFLERTEPTNPAQMLLRRARRLVNKNFLELVRELAPEAAAEVARIMGIPADEFGESVPTE